MTKSSSKPPKFKDFLKLLRSNNSFSRDEAYFMLLPFVNQFIPELKAAFETEPKVISKIYLMQLLEEAKSPELLEFFQKNLSHEEEAIRDCALHGLEKINTKEAKRIVWEVKSGSP